MRVPDRDVTVGDASRANAEDASRANVEDASRPNAEDASHPDADSTEQVRYRDTDRLGGTLRVSDDRLVVDPDGNDPYLVDPSTISEVTHRPIAWFQLLMGVGIVAFGLLSASRQLLAAAAFVLAGAASLLVTWRRRDRVRIRVHGRAKPLAVYPDDPEAFLSAVEDALERATPAEGSDESEESKESKESEEPEGSSADSQPAET